MTGTILITGASGFTGRHACKHFSGKGFRVAAVLHDQGKRRKDEESFICDLTKPEQVSRLIEEVQPDYMLHLAGRNAVSDSWREPVPYLETNLMSTFYLLDALRSLPLCRILVVGSMLNFSASESPAPPHPYSLSKTFQVWGALGWGHLFGQQVMIAKPSNLIGPGPSNGICGLLAKKAILIERGSEHTPFKLTSFDEERDYLDVRDAIVAYEHILCSGSPGTMYPVASGRNCSLGYIASVFQSMLQNGLTLEVGQVSNYVPPQPIDTSLTRSLGWKPSISFDQSLQEAVQYFRENIPEV